MGDTYTKGETMQNLSVKAPFFHRNGIKIYKDDCLHGMKEFVKEKSVSVVVTSPPYNIGIKYNGYHDRLPRESYLDWIHDVAIRLDEVLEDDGSFFLNVSGTPKDPWIPFDVAQKLRNIFVLQNTFIWVKSIAISKEDMGKHDKTAKDIAVGHYKPIGGTRFVNDCYEYIFHFTKKGETEIDRLAVGVPYKDKTNIKRWDSVAADLRCRGNTWFIPYETIWDKETQRPHPATFPIALPEMCVKLHGVKKVKLVLDPFIGIGSTAIACLKLGKECVGFDIDESYLQVAADRLTEISTRQSTVEDFNP